MLYSVHVIVFTISTHVKAALATAATPTFRHDFGKNFRKSILLKKS